MYLMINTSIIQQTEVNKYQENKIIVKFLNKTIKQELLYGTKNVQIWESTPNESYWCMNTLPGYCCRGNNPLGLTST